mmetsp:Transcript_39309/g.70355  ORF Transcript_39309/g.70355 Transcript_39309/m.70355 type:complete len:309 (+) Transcript_39309:336-1262(+)
MWARSTTAYILIVICTAGRWQKKTYAFQPLRSGNHFHDATPSALPSRTLSRPAVFMQQASFIHEVIGDDQYKECLQAKKDGVVAVEFFVPSCRQCKLLSTKLKSLADQAMSQAKLRVVLVNAVEPANKELVKKMGIKAVPFVQIFKEGTLLEQVRPSQSVVSYSLSKIEEFIAASCSGIQGKLAIDRRGAGQEILKKRSTEINNVDQFLQQRFGQAASSVQHMRHLPISDIDEFIKERFGRLPQLRPASLGTQKAVDEFLQKRFGAAKKTQLGAAQSSNDDTDHHTVISDIDNFIFQRFGTHPKMLLV